MSQQNENNVPHHFIISNGAMTLPHVIAFIVTVLAGAAVFFSLQSDVKVLDQRVTNVETNLKDQKKAISDIERNVNQMAVQIAQMHEKIMNGKDK
jgi:cell division protein FtsL